MHDRLLFPLEAEATGLDSSSCDMLKSQPQDLRHGAEVDHATPLGLAHFHIR